MRKISRKKTILGVLCAVLPVAAITTLIIRNRRGKTYAGL